MYMQYGPGSTGNVIAAVCSFFVPGLGQLVQGRPLKALFMFVLGVVMWFVMLGWLIHIWAILDAALYQPPIILYTAVSRKKGRKDERFHQYIGQDDSVV
jgi:TM2 domain-containing membrane protein YozV